jgi:hypothetical protein
LGRIADTLLEPRDIMVNPARPTVLKAADLPRVSPDNLVIAVAEKRRVKVDKVNAVRFHAFKDFEIIAEDKFIDRHGLLGFCFWRRRRRRRCGFFHYYLRRIASVLLDTSIFALLHRYNIRSA